LALEFLVKGILEAGWWSFEEVIMDCQTEEDKEVDSQMVEGTCGSMFGERLCICSMDINRESVQGSDSLNFGEPMW
jgi:hypothetical protein